MIFTVKPFNNLLLFISLTYPYKYIEFTSSTFFTTILNLSKTFKVLNQSVTLNSTIQAAQIKNLRQVITQTVALRNALGAR